MSRLTLIAWSAALAAAAYPTWDHWDYEIYSESRTYGCVGLFPGGGQDVGALVSQFSSSLASSLLGDASTLAELATQGALPALLVVVGFLAALKGKGGVAGRRVAGLLTVLAVAGPASPSYAGDNPCSGPVPVLTVEWFSIMIDAYGPVELCLMTSAVLVLLATRSGAAQDPTGLMGRRVAAFVMDYLVFTALLVLLPTLGGGQLNGLYYGLLNELDIHDLIEDPEPALVVLAASLYAVTGRTAGKRLMRIRMVSVETGHWPGWRKAAVRALVFPVLALVPLFGLLVLAVDVLWGIADPAARTLHDRLSGTMVTADPL